MWPKALIELLPHLSKLVPLLNRYFQGKGVNDDATRLGIERKLDEVAKALRTDAAQATAEASAANADIGRQLKQQGDRLTEQGSKVTALAADTRATRLAAESLEARMTRLEQRGTRQSYLMAVMLLQLATICILIALLFVSRHR